LLNGALRYENYSDFGGTTNLATRYKLTDNINLRGAISTGFRALHYTKSTLISTATQFVVVYHLKWEHSVYLKAAELLGIPQLKQEESQSASAGFS
jgi:iron complex outermembrane receptor protein